MYIGQAVDIYYRWNDYRRLLCKTQRLLYYSLRKYGLDKHEKEILCECKPEQLNELEKYYIDLYQTFNSKHGMNLRDGGGSRGKHSEKSNKINRKKHLGKKMSIEARQKISAAHKGRKLSEEHKNKIRLAHIGLNTWAKGRKISQEIKDKISINTSKIILNTETGIFYIGAKAAYESGNGNFKDLPRKLIGIRKNNTPFIYA